MTRAQFTFADLGEAALVELGSALGTASEPGLVIYLSGDLGMGKTTLARGFIQALGHQGAVKSPTYTLVEPYQFGTLQVFHFDLYRLSDAQELEFIGIHDYFGDFSVCLVEWPERGLGALPSAAIVITIEKDGPGRCVNIAAETEQGGRVLARLLAAWEKRDSVR